MRAGAGAAGGSEPASDAALQAERRAGARLLSSAVLAAGTGGFPSATGGRPGGASTASVPLA